LAVLLKKRDLLELNDFEAYLGPIVPQGLYPSNLPLDCGCAAI